MVTAVGSYTATAPLSSSGDWVMQMVAFRAATLPGGDTTPPTAPSGLGATAASSSQVNLAWTAATDTVGVTGYLVERCTGAGCNSFAQIGTATGTTFNSTGLAATTSYSYRVRATDAAGNLSPFSNIASATTPAAPDTQPPGAPTGLDATAVAPTQINLALDRGHRQRRRHRLPRRALRGRRLHQLRRRSATPTGTTFDDAGLSAATHLPLSRARHRAAGNLAAFRPSPAPPPAAPDTQPPRAPTGLDGHGHLSSQINLAWTAATDNVGVTGYRVERCQGAGCINFAQVATPTGTSSTTPAWPPAPATATACAPPTPRATSGRTRAPPARPRPPPTRSRPARRRASRPRRLGQPDQPRAGRPRPTTPPSPATRSSAARAPAARASPRSAPPPASTFPNTGLSPSTSYSYRVRATDAAGNLGAYSNVATAVTPSPPTAPAFVQSNYAVPQTPQTTVVVPFPGAQTAGNLNVVVVGWGDTVAHAITVTDSRGNAYTKAVGPTLNTRRGAAAQSIYYAANIVAAGAGANSVTVGFAHRRRLARHPHPRVQRCRSGEPGRRGGGGHRAPTPPATAAR